MSSSSRKKPLKTLEPLNAHDRDKRLWDARNSYSRGVGPSQPKTKHELDILKERHQFVRSNEVDPSALSWEDQLALKYYDFVQRVRNREPQTLEDRSSEHLSIGLRWRTEAEVLSGIGHLTCASLRCQFHQPDPSLQASHSQLNNDDDNDTEDLPIDPESSQPLVRTRLEENEMNFGYVEQGEKKSSLVKVVVCRECGKKLRRGREKAKEDRERAQGGVVSTTVGANQSRNGDERRDERGSERDQRRRSSEPRRDEDEEEDYTPSLPPDLERSRSSQQEESRSNQSPPTHSRRRSASPPVRRRH
ncbi:uncharacterized protein JCM6883_007571 [Sporobolomyces salmoneus]|uniref:uncharacterized protein n=1 Tax=Sporobolomyces salmoneus TaxID=183962 RepID=UPI00317A9D57